MQPTEVQQLLRIALGHHNAGRLQEAETIYRQLLASGDSADASHLLGMIEFQRGRYERAERLIETAITLNPNDAVIYNNLALVLAERHKTDQAIESYRRAIGLDPRMVEPHSNLAALLIKQGRLQEAIDACGRAIALNPNYAEAHHNRGVALAGMGRHDQAVVAYKESIRLRPKFAAAFHDLGLSLSAQARDDQAIDAYLASTQLHPECAKFFFSLGNAYRRQSRLEEAAKAFNQAISLQSDFSAAHLNLADVLSEQGKHESAVNSLARAIALRPEDAGAYLNLSMAMTDASRPDDGVGAAMKAISLQPQDADAWNNLAYARRAQGQLDAAMECYDRAVTLRPNDATIHSNRVYAMLFHPGCAAGDLLREQQLWNARHAPRLANSDRQDFDKSAANRRLRVGYVSPNFRSHVIGRNLLPLLREHDHESFHVICYSDVVNPDGITALFRSYADEWRQTQHLSDDALAQLIRADHVDILVDLTMHLAKNRLKAFARKPAPVQITFAAYPGGTGLDAIDYRLTDPFLDPPGCFDADYAEKSIRLAKSFWCYDPAAMTLGTSGDDVGELPALRNGYITFGCLNNFSKVNENVLDVWGTLMRECPASHLILQTPQGSARDDAIKRLSHETSGRIEFVPQLPLEQYLTLYQKIDIGLDTFPYNGHTTSLDAMWMGVPIVTLAGKTVVGRAGVSQLSNLGLENLVAHDCEQYVGIAAGLAADLSALSALRRGLRDRMERSHLCDARGFCRGIEEAYRTAWRLFTP